MNKDILYVCSFVTLCSATMVVPGLIMTFNGALLEGLIYTTITYGFASQLIHRLFTSSWNN